jgi:hypothetical protein
MELQEFTKVRYSVSGTSGSFGLIYRVDYRSASLAAMVKLSSSKEISTD